MDYETVMASRLRPVHEELPPRGSLTSPRPARRLRDAIEPLAMHVIYARGTNEELAGFGLNLFEAYVWGRAAALGEPPADLVVAAFGVFEPGRLAGTYETARRRIARTDLVEIRNRTTGASLQAVLGDADVSGAVAQLRRGLAAADVTARPLFAGLRSLPWPTDPAGQLWRACELLREHRGDSHLAACIGAGLDPVSMNTLTELWVGMPLGSYTATRGWERADTERAAGRLRARGLLDAEGLSEAGRRLREEIEERTDRQAQPIVDALGDAFEPLVAQLAAWSAACIAAGKFSPSAFKRAAG